MELNSKAITTPSNCYQYRTYIETLLNYGLDSKETHLASELFIKDEQGKFDNVTSSGFVKRKSFMNDDGTIELLGYLHNELSCQEKFLISKVDILFKFYRNSNDFSLMKASTDLKNYEVNFKFYYYFSLLKKKFIFYSLF